jgi:hypothetical protein
MSNRSRPATSAVHCRAKPHPGNGKARRNGGQSSRSDAREGPYLAMRHTPHAIYRDIHDDPRGVGSAAASSRRLRATLNPHRDRGTT